MADHRDIEDAMAYAVIGRKLSAIESTPRSSSLKSEGPRAMADLPTAILVVTGSRDWDGNPDSVAGVLRDFAARHPGHRLVLMHGDCPGERSVDQLAAARGAQLGFLVIPYPAPFRRFGKVAGPCRNGVMLSSAARLQADVVEVHGFPMPDSTGTHDCLRQAKEDHGMHGVVHGRRKRDG